MAMFGRAILQHSLPPKPPDSCPPPRPLPGVLPAANHRSNGSDTPIKCIIHSFNLPFRLIPGPDPNAVVFATVGAKERWLPAVGNAPTDYPVSKLPVHQRHVELLREMCREISSAAEFGCQATVVVSEPKHPDFRGQRRGVVTNVCLAGTPEAVSTTRGFILQRSPISLKSVCVSIDYVLFFEDDGSIRLGLTEHMENIARLTHTDVFVLRPVEPSPDSAVDLRVEASENSRLRIKICGEYECVEHAKMRLLIMIDDLIGHCLSQIPDIPVSTQTLICGRNRKHAKTIESNTRTAIYFPPPFPSVFGQGSPKAYRRDPNQIFITGEHPHEIDSAKRMILNMARSANLYFSKEVPISPIKIDYLLLDRLDEIKKIMEQNGTFVQFPPVGAGRGMMQVQGLESLHVERTIRAIMNIVGQFYNATWWVLVDQNPATNIRPPTAQEIQWGITDISAFSGADIAYNNHSFEICGLDESVKCALQILNEIPFVNQSPYQIRVKIELAKEHQEFVSGKKNGKINKIMGQSNIQILFDGFNEYNFFIDVCSADYASTMQGLELVEQELPASVAFHVPDSYHKRIIGIGGHHIQRIMKKYSVFVKFSNAMERGAAGRSEGDDLKVDNVVCRTPARNAANLELVKNEIMNMVQQVDAEIVNESVVIPRLLHRTLMNERAVLHDLETKWSCTIIFPSTEMASDIVTIKGPEWQIPQAVHEFLALVPESHQIRLPRSAQLDELINQRERVTKDVIEPMRNQFSIDMHFVEAKKETSETQAVSFAYTRNNAGGLRDAIEMLTSYLLACGIKAELVKGSIPRPKSDSFEDFAHFFNNKLIPQASGPAPDGIISSPGNRLSQGDLGNILGDHLHSEPMQMPLTDDTEAAFYNGGRRSVPGVGTVKPPGSAGSMGSMRGFGDARLAGDARRTGSRDSAEDGVDGVEATGLSDGEEWTKVDRMTKVVGVRNRVL